MGDLSFEKTKDGKLKVTEVTVQVMGNEQAALLLAQFINRRDLLKADLARTENDIITISEMLSQDEKTDAKI